MNNIEIVKYKQRLDHLFEHISVIANDEIKSHWARYLCVLVSGFIEISVKEIFIKYTTGKSTRYVVNYVSSELDGITNLKMQKIIDLAYRFNRDWGARFENETDVELKDAIDSIVANRNLIAHGDNVGISYVRIKDFYKRAVEVIDLLEQIVSR